jgi:acyl homoserine lactone synthase
MLGNPTDATAVVTTQLLNPAIVQSLFRFRKRLFVDILRWDLPAGESPEERDQFDRIDTVHVGLYQGQELIGCFRAIRTDHPYLTQQLFPHLAQFQGFPRAPDTWEISRFGVMPGSGMLAARVNYAVMFRFAQMVRARALVALVDLTYERFLTRLGIVTHRYGVPQSIGQDLDGRDMQAVAGEIPISEQSGERFQALMNLSQDVEVIDETRVFGRARLSA